jgi:hypothetical protein
VFRCRLRILRVLTVFFFGFGFFLVLVLVLVFFFSPPQVGEEGVAFFILALMGGGGFGVDSVVERLVAGGGSSSRAAGQSSSGDPAAAALELSHHARAFITNVLRHRIGTPGFPDPSFTLFRFFEFLEQNLVTTEAIERVLARLRDYVPRARHILAQLGLPDMATVALATTTTTTTDDGYESPEADEPEQDFEAFDDDEYALGQSFARRHRRLRFEQRTAVGLAATPGVLHACVLAATRAIRRAYLRGSGGESPAREQQERLADHLSAMAKHILRVAPAEAYALADWAHRPLLLALQIFRSYARASGYLIGEHNEPKVRGNTESGRRNHAGGTGGASPGSGGVHHQPVVDEHAAGSATAAAAAVIAPVDEAAVLADPLFALCRETIGRYVEAMSSLASGEAGAITIIPAPAAPGVQQPKHGSNFDSFDDSNDNTRAGGGDFSGVVFESPLRGKQHRSRSRGGVERNDASAAHAGSTAFVQSAPPAPTPPFNRGVNPAARVGAPATPPPVTTSRHRKVSSGRRAPEAAPSVSSSSRRRSPVRSRGSVSPRGSARRLPKSHGDYSSPQPRPTAGQVWASQGSAAAPSSQPSLKKSTSKGRRKQQEVQQPASKGGTSRGGSSSRGASAADELDGSLRDAHWIELPASVFVSHADVTLPPPTAKQQQQQQQQQRHGGAWINVEDLTRGVPVRRQRPKSNNKEEPEQEPEQEPVRYGAMPGAANGDVGRPGAGSRAAAASHARGWNNGDGIVAAAGGFSSAPHVREGPPPQDRASRHSGPSARQFATIDKMVHTVSRGSAAR